MSLTTRSTGRTVTRGIGVLLIAGVLVGATAAAAQASTPGAGPGAVGSPPQTTPKAGDAVFLNASPDMAVLTGSWDTDESGVAILPGHSVVLTAAQLNAGPDMSIDLRPADGTDPTFIFAGLTDQPGIHSCAAKAASNPNVSCVAQVPAGGQGPTQYTVWESEAHQDSTNTIDTTAPGVDTGAIGNFLSGMRSFQPGWITFAADPSIAPTWGTGKQVQAGPVVWNCGQGQAHTEIGGTAEHSESSSLEVSATVGISADLFDLVNTSLSTTITGGNTWTDTTTTSHTESKDIDPFSKGWMTSEPSTQTVTGTITMTGNATRPIQFTDVTFTEPGRNPSNNPNLDYAYVAHSLPMTQDEITQQCTAGPTALAHTVTGGSVPDITAGAN